MGKVHRFPHPTDLSLSTYVDNEDTPEDRETVKAHLQKCSKCRYRVSQMRFVDGLYKSVTKRGK